MFSQHRAWGIGVKIIRSVVGVILGYATFAVSAVLFFYLAGRDPHQPQGAAFAVAAVVFGMTMAALGGFIAATIAGRRPILHAGIVAGIVALGAFVSLISSLREGAIWSQVAALLLMAPSALLAGVAKTRFSSKRLHPPASS
jgi:hypothetical protein